ncbi:hypothetical protein DFJ74DRAFT_705950 [Hyaloraphidium curvatum]|nr:hypothetical protein DFJ74DRAFT_705950 [Hyaloraphidium curvatum]
MAQPELTESEWLALLPAPLPATEPPPVAPAVPPPADLAAEARSARPLTKSALLRALSAEPLLVAILRVRLAAAAAFFGGNRTWVRQVVYGCSVTALYAAVYVFNDGRFGTLQIVFANVAYFVAAVGVGLAIRFRPFSHVDGAEGAAAGDRIALPEGDKDLLDGVQQAGIARWMQLCQGARIASGEVADKPGLFLRHVSGDRFCTCPRPSCCGGIPARAVRWSIAFSVFVCLAFGVGNFLTATWTPLVTFAARTWTTSWSAILAMLSVVACVGFHWINGVGMNWGSPPAMDLEFRLARRAVSEALSSVVLRFKHALSEPEDAAARQDLGADPPEFLYYRLHQLIALAWKFRARQIGSITLSLLTVEIIPIAANIFAGSCVTANNLASLAATFVLVYIDLSLTALSNHHIDLLSSLFTSARRETRALLSLALARSDPLAPSLQAHLALLDSCAEADGYRSRVLGFVVSAGNLRALAVAALTVGVGLWSALRTSVFVTAENVCPLR